MFILRRRLRVKRRHLAPGSYLTDGNRLFQVKALFVSGGCMLASIEDCLSLETRNYAATELERMPLRAVRGMGVGAFVHPGGASRRSQSRPFHVDPDMKETEHDLDRI